MAVAPPIPLISLAQRSSDRTNPVARFLDQYFYCFMAVVIAAVVFSGFSFTVNKNLIHPPLQRPAILWLHGIVFSSWLLYFILQTALVRVHSVRVHRNLGWFGVALATAMYVLGIETVLVMARYYVHKFHATDANLLIVPFWDIDCFAACFALAILLRKKPEHHRRLALLATCALSAAGWGRFPFLPPGSFYLGVDLFILMGIARDLIVNRRVHLVYKAGLPVFIFGQAFAMFVVVTKPAWWAKFAFAIVG